MALQKITRSYTEPGIEGETRDCAVRAIAVACCVSYAEAYFACEIAGRRPREATYVPEMLGALTLVLGKVPPRIEGTFRHRGGLARRDYWSAGRSDYMPDTLTQFLAKHPEGHYVLYSYNHAFAVCDGVVHDYQQTTGPRTRIQGGWRVDI